VEQHQLSIKERGEMTEIKESQRIAHIFNEPLVSHNDVYWTDQNQGKLFAEGHGQSRHGNTDGKDIGQSNEYGTRFGSWTLIPYKTFFGDVKVWGAGGGGRGYDTGNAYGAGAGHSKARVKFLKDIPYTILVGQGGDHTTHRHSGTGGRGTFFPSGTFGNGGGGAQHGGSGGGLSGIFFNTFPNAGGPGHGHGYIGTPHRAPARSNALIIAGGGGGSGHHSNSNHGQAGAGGGTTGNAGHNAGGGSQTGGGGNWSYGTQAGYALHGGHAGDGSSSGGGGGGWYGGAGGAFHSNHHNGGGGGSGHLLDLHSQSGYPNFWIKTKYPDLVASGETESGTGAHGNNQINAGRMSDPDWNGAGLGGGSQGQDAGTRIFGLTGLGLGGHNHAGYNGRVTIKAVSISGESNA